jgi:hypothetical protein
LHCRWTGERFGAFKAGSWLVVTGEGMRLRFCTKRDLGDGWGVSDADTDAGEAALGVYEFHTSLLNLRQNLEGSLDSDGDILASRVGLAVGCPCAASIALM